MFQRAGCKHWAARGLLSLSDGAGLANSTGVAFSRQRDDGAMEKTASVEFPPVAQLSRGPSTHPSIAEVSQGKGELKGGLRRGPKAHYQASSPPFWVFREKEGNTEETLTHVRHQDAFRLPSTNPLSNSRWRACAIACLFPSRPFPPLRPPSPASFAHVEPLTSLNSYLAAP